MSSLPSIVKKSLTETAVETLREGILGGTIRPGARLTEIQLASALGIARSTLRAALLELEREDLVERKPYSAWAVPELTATVVWEVYTLRAALESLAARLVAANLTDAARTDLLAAYARLEVAERDGEATDRADADLHFPATIVAHCGHQRLIRQYRILRAKIVWVYRWSEDRWARRVSLSAWHRPVLDAILSRSPEAAETAVRLLAEANTESDLARMRAAESEGLFDVAGSPAAEPGES